MEVRKEGWLQKKGGDSRRNWKKRYFLLDGTCIRYYTDENMRKEKGA